MYSVGIRPSYKTGFAQWPGMSEYPQLWRGLAGAWDMSLGQTGNKVFDLSGNGNQGTLVGHTHFVFSKFGPSLSFDGNGDDYVSIPDIPIEATDWTFSTLIYVDDLTADERCIFHKDVANKHVMRIEKNGGLVFWTFASTDDRKATAAGVITARAWYHVVFVYRYVGGDNNDGEFYVNGVEKANAGDDDAMRDISSGAATFDIGLRVNGPYDPFDGRIDHAIFWTRALPVSEIALLYQLRKRQA